MKIFFKHIIPSFLWNTFRYIKTYSFRDVGRVGVFDVIRIAKKEYGGTKGVLDYSKKEIPIVLNSFTEIARLTPCTKEPKTVQWIEENLKSGDVFYDIGANIGAYSFIASAKADTQCIVYAFEPNFFTFVSLSQNIILNNLSQKIVPLCVALSGVTQISGFNYSDMGAGSAQHMLFDHFDISNTNIQPVLAYSLDNFINTFNIPIPNLIKIDVDGVELGVLEGARNTLKKPQLRSVIVEIDTTQKAHSDIIQKIMLEAGFVLVDKHPLGKGKSTTLFNCVFERVK